MVFSPVLPYYQSLQPQTLENTFNDELSSDLNKRLWFVTSNKKINRTFFHVIKEHLKFHHNHTWNLSLLVLLELVWSWICRKVVWILKNTPGYLMFKTLVMFTHLDIKVTAPRHVFWSVIRKKIFWKFSISLSLFTFSALGFQIFVLTNLGPNYGLVLGPFKTVWFCAPKFGPTQRCTLWQYKRQYRQGK